MVRHYYGIEPLWLDNITRIVLGFTYTQLSRIQPVHRANARSDCYHYHGPSHHSPCTLKLKARRSLWRMVLGNCISLGDESLKEEVVLDLKTLKLPDHTL